MNKNLSYEVSHVVVTPRLIELLKQKPKGRYTRLEAYFDLLSRAMVKKPFTVLPKTAAAELLGEFDTTVTELAEKWGWQRATVRDFLSELSKIGQLAREDSYKSMTITFEALKFKWIQEVLDKDQSTLELLNQSDSKAQMNEKSSSKCRERTSDTGDDETTGYSTEIKDGSLLKDPAQSDLEKKQRKFCRQLYEEIFSDMSDLIKEWAYTPKVEHALYRAFYNICGGDRQRWQDYLDKMANDNTLTLTIYSHETVHTTAEKVESYFIRFGTDFLQEDANDMNNA
ncbi:hypothetical protein [Parabacteroides leei]|jgi:hypothetical protein|uniref:hypothetical protein n=1 Tax=Parabacteroides leei TaxID=2939491 RepID=UPI001898B0F2|nr:hypothetical protein [Parabacteroides goldsteinii]